MQGQLLLSGLWGLSSPAFAQSSGSSGGVDHLLQNIPFLIIAFLIYWFAKPLARKFVSFVREATQRSEESAPRTKVREEVGSIEKGARIFISYRRDDAAPWAGRIHERLSRDFEKNQLFMDVDHISPGLDFVKVLDQQVAACNVLICVIGKNWLNASGEADSAAWTMSTISYALRSKVR
jgi:hypothetical protein